MDDNSLNQCWFGGLPSKWECRRIKNVCQLRTQPSSHEDPYLGLEDLISFGDLSVEWDAEKAKSATGSGGLSLPGDVVFSKLRVYLAKGMVVRRKLRCTTELIVLTPVGVAAQYLNLVFKSEAFIYYLDTLSYGTKMPRIGPRFLLESVIPVPPAAEQQAIVEYLEAKTAEIDGLVVKLERERELLERYRRELIARTVTRGLNPNTTTRDSGIDWIGQIPVPWETIPLKRVLRVMSGAEVIVEVPESPDAVPVFGSGSRAFKYTDRSIIDRKAIIFGRKGTLGLPYVLTPPFWVVDTAYVGLPKDNVEFDYLAFLLQTIDWRPFITNTAKPSLVANDILVEKVPLPPRREQREIVAFLDDKTSEIDLLVGKIDKQIEMLGQYRKQVINDVVTGKIRVGAAA